MRARRTLGSLFALAFALGGCAPPGPSQKPSILLVTFDTLRADHVGCYGATDASTPNLDRLAAAGTRFDDARTLVPLTLPSHATILTGLVPPHHGVRGNGVFRLDPATQTLAAVLRESGYGTAAVVSSVVLDREFGLDRGFEIYDDNQRVGDKAAFNYLERGASQVEDSATRVLARLAPPFFLWVHFYDPHRPWVAPAAFELRHPGRPYDAEIAFSDAAFGRVWQAAAARAGAELIVLTSGDHGESLGEHGENQHGYTLHRGVLRVPLLVAGPGIRAGAVIRETVALTDVAPTLAEFAGATLAPVDGRSLAPLTRGEPAPPPISESNPLWEESLHPLYDSGWAPLRGIITQAWHFVAAKHPELYDRKADPDDRTDLAATHPDQVRLLQAQLAQLAERYGDVPEPVPNGTDSPAERELLEKLSSLGYLAAGNAVPRAGPRLDPKDGLPGFLALEQAEALFAQGRAREAYELLLPFIRTDPDNPRLLHAESKALLAMGRLAEAGGPLRRALELDPRSEFIRFTHADLLRARGEPSAAADELRSILAANPRSVEASLELAESLDATGAEEVLAASCAAGTHDADLLLRLGLLLERRGAHDEAERRFAEALTLRPEDPAALLATGRAALRANDPARAVGLLERCVGGPRAFECRIELARALVLGERDLVRARAILESALPLARTDALRAEVERRLAALDQMERSSARP